MKRRLVSVLPALAQWASPPGAAVRDLTLLWMTAIFLTCLLLANLTGSLLFRVALPGDGSALLSAGIIPFPLTFLLTDLLNEFYGKQAARLVTLIGFAASALACACLLIAQQLPVDAQSPFSAAQFQHFSGLYTGMIVASLAAYLVGQLLDIQIFQIFHRWTRHRLLWLRAQGSTAISQVFDSLIVTTIAFWGQLPADAMTRLALSNYAWKLGVVILITPLLYLGHALLRRLIGAREAAA